MTNRTDRHRRVSLLSAGVLAVVAMGVAALAPASSVSAERVDPHRGRWDLVAEIPEGGAVDLRLLVDEIAADPDDPAATLATGCVKTLANGTTTPMSLRSVDQGDGTSNVIIYATLVLDDLGAVVTAFTGAIEFGGKSVRDDAASGALQTDFGDGTWSGVHHDRRNPKCGSFDFGEVSFNADAYTASSASDPDSGGTILEAYTQIVSSAMVIESDSFGRLVAPLFTDLFSPQVDFVSEFRLLTEQEGLPELGEEFTFTLLDLFGREIPGATSTDVWNGCHQGAPQNIQGTYVFEDYLELTWDPVAPARGFDPANGLGLYQVESDGGFGASGIRLTSHRIPWTSFEGFAPGIPDGDDFGAALSEFGDGSFSIDIISFSDAAGPGEVGTACQIRDEGLPINVLGSEVTIGTPPR